MIKQIFLNTDVMLSGILLETKNILLKNGTICNFTEPDEHGFSKVYIDSTNEYIGIFKLDNIHFKPLAKHREEQINQILEDE